MSRVLIAIVMILMVSCSNSNKSDLKSALDSSPKNKSEAVEQPISKKSPSPKSQTSMDDYKYITAVRKDNVWYFINERNEVLFDKEFTYAGYFSDGLACVAMDGMRWPGEDRVFGAYYTAMDKEGNFIREIKSDLPFTFHDGRTIISYGEDKMLIDKRGNVKKQSNLKAYSVFAEGKVAVFKDGKIEYWDKEGEVVIGPESFTTQEFNEDRALVLLNGKYGFIDEKGELVVDYQYDGGANFYEGLAWVKKGEEFFFIDKSGNQKLGPFQNVRSFSEGKAAAYYDGSWKYIDSKGQDVFGKSFAEVDDFSEGIAIVRQQDGQLSMLKESGELKELDARVAFQFANGFAIAEKNGMMGYINKEGDWVIDAQYENITDFTER